MQLQDRAAQWCSGWSDGHTKLRQLSNGSSSLTIKILSVVSGVTTLRLANLPEKHLVA